MLKQLLKKQFLETASFFFISNKNGKRRSPLVIVAFIALIVYALATVSFLIWEISQMLCAPLVQGGLAWVYFAFFIVIATSLGCISTVFYAKSRLFEAKDNDFLLSLPIRPWIIIFSRMTSLYLFTFSLQALILLPAFVHYFTVVAISFAPVVFQLILLFVLPLGTMAICSLLGWLIAIVTSRVRAKNLFSILFFVAFMVGYFLLINKMNEYLLYIVANGEKVAGVMKKYLFPFWQAGLGATGEPLGAFTTCLLFGGAFAIVYFLLSKTFYLLVTVRRGEKKKKYTEKTVKNRSAGYALFSREFLRFFKNPLIVLNSALGSVFLLILPFILLFKPDLYQQIAQVEELKGIITLILCTIVCGISAFNTVTASSVSLEGETIWLVRSLPVSTKSVFLAKIALHVTITALPALFCVILLSVLCKLGVGLCLLSILTIISFVFLCAQCGLALNLKFPNMHWTNEIATVKQSVSVLITMLSSIILIGLCVGGYFLFGRYLPAGGFLAIVCALFTVLAVALYVWLFKKGVKLFENLQ